MKKLPPRPSEPTERSSRRDLLRWTAAGAVASLAGSFSSWAAADEKGTAKAPAPKAGAKRLLVMGGTRFLGPEIVEAAKAGGWTITLFNRGKSNPHLFPELEKLHGDRNKPEELSALKDRTFDAVVDTSGYYPKQVRSVAAVLGGRVGQYVFVSSISVYADTSKPGLDESGAVGRLPDSKPEVVDKIDKISEGNYGPLKALCEEAAEAAWPGKTTNVRPGLIVGPNDGTDRFTYWPVRIDRGGEVLAPGTPDDPVQFIDVRDLGTWIVRAIDAKHVGVFNATGPAAKLGIGGLLAACQKATTAKSTLTWVSREFLDEKKVEAWSDMPVWLPPVGETAGANSVSAAKAIAKGLTYRPLADTCRDTLAWWKKQPEERRAKLRAGISAEREAEVLKAWRERKATA